ncbi:methyltransferase domain-containing protein [Deinococcus yavapaiensis]|uniref:23S rRNA G2445 N2-methylase RlmL n=1 Tax=Deinococcus yavapaiensis KR-236 TaxID=694435 RepID=A0A318S975_9DEIO|nr:methyltransferase domain-containing protein [Deinococcus yavapaiensis]PYE55265.1 23S rRNA G2445 N2-methylase RlmL [Deinococcus yavapaiensis KR-236]
MKPRLYEIEVLGGLEEFALQELQGVKGVKGLDGPRFLYAGDTRTLKRLKSVVAVYVVESFFVPRPKALLGHQHLLHLVAFVRDVTSQDSFSSFRFSAAGRDSAVFERLALELESATGLKHLPEEGELLLRVVPGDEGWDVLARITPKPLSARAWRVCNMSGGLNATVAHAMLRFGGIRENDRVFNPMCGSGTLLIERSLIGPVETLVGVDKDPDALTCARENVAASKRGGIELHQVDITTADMPTRAFDLIVADLPWGDAIGSHDDNAILYPAFLKAMGRAVSKRGRMVVLTHEVRLFQEVLEEDGRWKLLSEVKVYHGGHYPRMYLLGR